MLKNKALLLDRDGVINEDTGYIGSPHRFAFMQGLFPFLRTVRDRGFRLAIVTNQAGVALGLYSEEDYCALTAHMLEGLKGEGIEIEHVFACFEHVKGVKQPFIRESFWRKPQPGMILDAARRLRIDTERSAMIGDNLKDMQAAEAGGIKRRLWYTPQEVEAPAGVNVVRTFDEALSFLK